MISIIVCTYNREQYLPKMLQSVAAQKCNFNDFELVLVNNNSTDETHLICEKFVAENPSLPVRYFVETKQGLSFARNRGLKEAKGTYFVFIDDDAFLSDNYITELTSYLKNAPKELGFGGKILPFLECELPNWMSKYLESLMSVLDLGNEIKPFKGAKYPVGANMGFSASVVQKIGYFNEELGRTGNSMLGGEEKDFFFRMKAANIPILYFPKMMVHHVIPAKRLTVEFIQKLALGIGESERLRTKKNGIGFYLYRWILELYKWGGTFALFIIYLFKASPSKGIMLIKFRYWISKGLWG